MEPLGFVPDDEGFAAFGDALKQHEVDPTFNELSKEMKKIMKDSITPLVGDESEGEEELEGDEVPEDEEKA